MASNDTTRNWDNAHFMHPWEDMSFIGSNERTEIEEGRGIYVRDADGREFIDGPGGMWCVQIGYGREEMAEAIAEQARKLAYFTPFYNTSSISVKLAHEISKRTPGDLNHIFFTTGGSTAVDTALRFVQFRNNVLGKPEKKIIIALNKSYHGSTYLSSSVSGKERNKLWLDKADQLVCFQPDVSASNRPAGTSEESFLDGIVQELESSILNLGPENVSTFIAEPIQASGGVIIPPHGFHKRCLDVCRKYNVIYVSDEVVTGFGRLGHWFASEEVFDLVPDMITCAKGMTSGYLPMGAVAVSDRLVQEISENCESNTLFSNGYTYSGHPVCAAAALKNIEIMESEGILDSVLENSPLFLERLNALGDLSLVVETRGMGLVGCVECSRNNNLADDMEIGVQIDSICDEMGLLVRPIINMCVVSPPLIINQDEINKMFDILEKGIKAV